MFASIRRYRVGEGSVAELTRRVDDGFAEQISTQPGFVSYEFIDCGNDEIMTVSIFRDVDGAEASRDMAQHWTDENLTDFEFTRSEPLRGEILVSRAAQDMLEPGHAGGAERFANVRRYQLKDGSVADLMHIVDTMHADRIAEIDGFDAYHAIDCGDGGQISISVFRDERGADESNELSRRFASDELGDFDLERTETIAGKVTVSRSRAELLEPAHA
jgi:heme-degrading monooxygenase HmoA